MAKGGLEFLATKVGHKNIFVVLCFDNWPIILMNHIMYNGTYFINLNKISILEAIEIRDN